MNRWVEEQLNLCRPTMPGSAWCRGAARELGCFLSYDGVLYGLPAEPPVAGSVVQVRERQLQLRVFSKGNSIATLTKRRRSHEIVQHPDQFQGVADWFCAKTEQPLGHQVTPPTVEIPNLADYDQLFSQEAPQ